MIESPFQPSSLEKAPAFTENSTEKMAHLDVASLMKEKGCYFVHMLQVTKMLDVSDNNKSLDTKSLSTSDRLDILYGASPSLSVSTIRPKSNDGTFYGGFGVLLSRGEVVSAEQGDSGTVAVSLTERHIIGGVKDSREDINAAIDRKNEGGGKSYNELVVKSPEVAGGFMKIDNEAYQKRISYEDEVQDYGSGGGEIIGKIGVLDLTNNKDANFNVPFSVLLEMRSRGPVFLMDEDNQMLQVSDIDEKSRRVTFSPRPFTPGDVSEVYGDTGVNKYAKQEMLQRLSDKGFTLH